MKKFFTILLVVFLVQLPTCIITLQNDAGLIEYSGNETLIRTAERVTGFFMFPLVYFLSDKIKSNEWALLIYILNLLLISYCLFLVIKYTGRWLHRKK